MDPTGAGEDPFGAGARALLHKERYERALGRSIELSPIVLHPLSVYRPDSCQLKLSFWWRPWVRVHGS